MKFIWCILFAISPVLLLALAYFVSKILHPGTPFSSMEGFSMLAMMALFFTIPAGIIVFIALVLSRRNLRKKVSTQ